MATPRPAAALASSKVGLLMTYSQFNQLPLLATCDVEHCMVACAPCFQVLLASSTTIDLAIAFSATNFQVPSAKCQDDVSCHLHAEATQVPAFAVISTAAGASGSGGSGAASSGGSDGTGSSTVGCEPPATAQPTRRLSQAKTSSVAFTLHPSKWRAAEGCSCCQPLGKAQLAA